MAIATATASATDYVDGINTTGLESRVDTAIAGLTNHMIRGVQVVVDDKARRTGRELDVIVTHESPGNTTLTDPYQVKVFTGRTAAEVDTAAAAYRTANPGNWYAPPFYRYINEVKPSIDPHVILQFYCTDSNGGLNWDLSGGTPCDISVVEVSGDTTLTNFSHGDKIVRMVGASSLSTLTLDYSEWNINDIVTIEVDDGELYNVKIDSEAGQAIKSGRASSQIIVMQPGERLHFRLIEANTWAVLGDRLEYGIITPEMFGAVGDGTTDDTTAIQAALNKAGRIRFTQTYAVDCTVELNPKSNSHLDLTETATIKALDPGGANHQLFVIQDTEAHIRITGGHLQGHDPSTGIKGIGIFINGANDVIVDSVKITDWSHDAIKVGGDTSSNDIRISKCYVNNVERNGMSLSGSCQRVIISNCTFDTIAGSAPEDGIDIEPNVGCVAQDIIVEGCTFNSPNGNGISVRAGSGTTRRVSISGGIITDAGGVGVLISSARSVSVASSLVIRNPTSHGIDIGGSAENFAITGCVINSPGGRGIRIAKTVFNGIVSGCQINNASSIGIQDSSRRVLLTSNTIVQAGDDGISCDSGADGKQISSNSIILCAQNGITLSHCQNMQITNNVITECGTDSDNTYYGISIRDYTYNCNIQNNRIRYGQYVQEGTAQAGANDSITLDVYAVNENDYYNGMEAVLVGGTGSGQSETINDYDGGTLVATIDTTWGVNPDNTTEYIIRPAVLLRYGIYVMSNSVSNIVTNNDLRLSGKARDLRDDGINTVRDLFRVPVVTVSANTTLVDRDFFVIQDTAGITTSLWAAPLDGDVIEVRNKSAGNTVISGNGNTVEGAASLTLLSGESVRLVWDDPGSDWTIF